MKKALALTTGALIAMFALVGCNSVAPAVETPAAESTNTSIKVESFTITTEDGREVECIYATSGIGKRSTGGPSCDWEGARTK